MERVYEVLYIVRPDIEKSEYEQVISRYEQSVKENGGSVKEIDEWGVRSFAYDIDHYDKGYYVLMKFVLGPPKLPALKERYKLDERVLRHQIVRQEELAEVPNQVAA